MEKVKNVIQINLERYHNFKEKYNSVGILFYIFEILVKYLISSLPAILIFGYHSYLYTFIGYEGGSWKEIAFLLSAFLFILLFSLRKISLHPLILLFIVVIIVNIINPKTFTTGYLADSQTDLEIYGRNYAYSSAISSYCFITVLQAIILFVSWLKKFVINIISNISLFKKYACFKEKHSVDFFSFYFFETISKISIILLISSILYTPLAILAFKADDLLSLPTFISILIYYLVFLFPIYSYIILFSTKKLSFYPFLSYLILFYVIFHRINDDDIIDFLIIGIPGYLSIIIIQSIIIFFLRKNKQPPSPNI